jgi:hypothetical protein
MAENGYNPMHWDCERQGCFNKKKRPKIEIFADCLPGRIAFSDIDAAVEVEGNFLILEFKEHDNIPKGQRIFFNRLTHLAPATVLVIEADVETMEISGMIRIFDGKINPQIAVDLDGLKQEIRDWSQWALKNSKLKKAANMKMSLNSA